MPGAGQWPGLVLVSMPWPLFNRPSIQLATLKAFLKEAGWPVRAHHLYLRLLEAIGPEVYYSISQTTWLSEPVGAAALFEEMAPRAEALFRKKAPARGLPKDIFPSLVSAFKRTVEGFLEAFSPKGVLLVGFSVCLNQLTASLYAARRLKERWPQIPILFGGSSCAGKMGVSLLKAFPFIDYVISGEGELPLALLAEFLAGRRGEIPEGVFFRKKGEIWGGGMLQVDDLEQLPPPDFSDYFQDLALLPAEKRFFPVIPLEFSRGCWWGKCRFCNLNLQWRGYRVKSPERMAAELRAYAQGLGLLDFALMDNVLPPAKTRAFFKALAADGRDYRIFCELRAHHRAGELEEMHRGGLVEIQVGIEALSSSLLRRLGKGTTAMDNVAIMKSAQEAGLILHGNLITGFPSSSPEEVAETLLALDYVFPYRPLKAVSFWLGYGSPVFRDPGQYGLKRLYPHPYYRYLFPRSLLKNLVLPAWGYSGGVVEQKRLWRPVLEKTKAWAEAHRRLKGEGPLLSYRDGGNFLLIRQVLPNGAVRHHRLKGASRQIYLFLETPRHLKEIIESSGLAEDRLLPFLKALWVKRLIFQEAETYLALAIRRRA
ncbi:RiPP maturation radical SAM C-methyltransferase [Thermosulfuriphilus sp.]